VLLRDRDSIRLPELADLVLRLLDDLGMKLTPVPHCTQRHSGAGSFSARVLDRIMFAFGYP
jgi:hypothetical protein